MKFILIPILERMLNLYGITNPKLRFDQYLELLQGESKEDVELPIMGYNPMGKELVQLCLKRLIDLNAEQIASEVIEHTNTRGLKGDQCNVIINLVDDLGGAWSNRHTTDYQSKFRTKDLVKRKFCTPIFWTSDTLKTALIELNIKSAIQRFIYQIQYGDPITLEDHVNQEVYVSSSTSIKKADLTKETVHHLSAYYASNLRSEDYSLIFNFFYGDKASERLAYSTYGIPDNAGIKFCSIL